MKTKTRRSAAVVLLAFICFVWAAPAVADVNKAREHSKKGEYAAALRELRPLVEVGDPAALNAMGVLLRDGHGVTKDLRAAVEYIRKSAEKGNPEGQYNWATMLVTGEGVAKDERKAAEWYRKSADQGDADAQRDLGLLYAEGVGLEKDLKIGIQWQRKAAEQGDALAQTNLGWYYWRGLGVPQDDRESTAWFRKAAEQGEATGQLRMGVAYLYGHGVDKDEREAVRWFRMGADQGDGRALNNLGNFYERGVGGLRQDYVEAVRLYEVAARQGIASSQRNLARMYREGLGVRSDAVVAYSWFSLAASAESPDANAADERDAMTKYMPKNLIAEGQRLAREWKPGMALGKSKLKPVDVASLQAAWADKVGKAPDAMPAEQPAGQYPARPEAKPGLTTCNTRCVNGDCYRTYGDGRKVHFQARQKWNPFNNQFEWDSGNC